jgi:hypothetical protein
MGMSATNQQIVELAKRGFDSEQIAMALGLSVEGVMAVITQDSGAVKELAKAGIEQDFDKMRDMSIKGLEHLAMYAENEGVRAKVLMYILDQQLGLKKPKDRLTVTNNFEFLVQRAEKAKALRDSSVLDIEASVIKPA